MLRVDETKEGTGDEAGSTVESSYCFTIRTRVRNLSTYIRHLQFWLLWKIGGGGCTLMIMILKRLKVRLGMMAYTCDPCT